MEKASRKGSKRGLIAILGGAALVIIGVVIALIFILGNKKQLIGKWVAEKGSWYYNFTSETEGGYGTDAFDIPDQPFTYKDTGDTLVIQYKNVTTPTTLKYHFEDDGKKLVIADSFGNDTVYVRK
ncbi:hypothetical protein IKX64_03260 [Candidatus Saccharibacteria bacterium]|nr:hypothetical protein [Candidatus Saccharibacteria bacterium]